MPSASTAVQTNHPARQTERRRNGLQQQQYAAIAKPGLCFRFESVRRNHRHGFDFDHEVGMRESHNPDQRARG